MTQVDMQDSRPPEGTGEARASEPRLRPALLWTLLAVSVVFSYVVYANWFLVGYPHVSEVRAWMNERADERQLAVQFANDPALGAFLPDVLEKIQSRGPGSDPNRRCIVVFGGPLGPCCSDKAVAQARSLQAAAHKRQGLQSVEVVVVFRGATAAVHEYARSTKQGHVRLIPDEEGALDTAYNAFWAPRVYALVGGRLRWIQKSARADTGAILDACATNQAPAYSVNPNKED